ncbi:hypothetical protein [Nocardioides marmoraquaticus]
MSISLNTLTLPLVSRATESIYGLSLGLHSALSGSAAAGPTPMAICPKAPPGATQPVNEITGYVVWGVIILFGLALIIGLGAIVAGRIFSMPHASKVGVISLVVVFVAAVAYLVLPGMLDGILGNGCV